MSHYTVNSADGLTNAIKRALKDYQKKIQETANTSIWVAMQEFKPIVEKEFTRIILKNFYQARPESEFYTRTYQFANCGTVTLTQGGGHYKMNLYLNATELNLTAPDPPFTTGGMKRFWSYGYFSAGDPENLVGEPLNIADKEDLVTMWDEQYNITPEVRDFVESNFPRYFEKDFDSRKRTIF